VLENHGISEQDYKQNPQALQKLMQLQDLEQLRELEQLPPPSRLPPPPPKPTQHRPPPGSIPPRPDSPVVMLPSGKPDLFINARRSSNLNPAAAGGRILPESPQASKQNFPGRPMASPRSTGDNWDAKNMAGSSSSPKPPSAYPSNYPSGTPVADLRQYTRSPSLGRDDTESSSSMRAPSDPIPYTPKTTYSSPGEAADMRRVPLPTTKPPTPSTTTSSETSATSGKGSQGVNTPSEVNPLPISSYFKERSPPFVSAHESKQRANQSPVSPPVSGTLTSQSFQSPHHLRRKSVKSMYVNIPTRSTESVADLSNRPCFRAALPDGRRETTGTDHLGRSASQVCHPDCWCTTSWPECSLRK